MGCCYMKPLNRDIHILGHIISCCQQIEETFARFGNDGSIFSSDPIYRNATALCILQKKLEHFSKGSVSKLAHARSRKPTLLKYMIRVPLGYALLVHGFRLSRQDQQTPADVQELPRSSENAHISLNLFLYQGGKAVPNQSAHKERARDNIIDRPIFSSQGSVQRQLQQLSLLVKHKRQNPEKDRLLGLDRPLPAALPSGHVRFPLRRVLFLAPSLEFLCATIIPCHIEQTPTLRA